MTAGSAPAPAAQGLYVTAKRDRDLIFTAGMTPRENGVLILTGPVRSATIDTWREAVVLACRNALAAARGALAPGERLASILSLTVYVFAEPGFTAHSQLADFASDFLRRELGDDGIASRAAVGVASLPGNAPVEIQLTAVAAGSPSSIEGA